MHAHQDEPVAVVGAACRFPGGADSLGSLWRLLVDRRETVRDVPPDRWDQAELAGLPAPVADRLRRGCFLDGDVYAYDPEFFGINAEEAPWVDPEHRLLSEVAWEAVEHAGIPVRDLSGTPTGLFFGLYQKDYLLRTQRPLEDVNAYAMYTGFDSVGPGRLGFLLNLRGPQIVVESACASGLAAVHTACQSLRTGESDLALAGAATLTLGPEGVIAPALWGVFSPTGRCHAFDAAADGYVRGEGCAVVVLKRLTDALRARDRVLAVVRGSAVNQNGRGTRLSAPSAPAQTDLYRLALRRAGVEAADVAMVEAHGPGTAVGDPIEFSAVAAVYGRGRDRCALGSVKTNIGHTEPVSGVAGLLKAVAALRHGLVPASLHFTRWNPQIDPGGTRLFVPTDTTDWPVRDGTRLAAVSSFGISGTNVHVVLEQAPGNPPARSAPRPSPAAARTREGTPRMFPLSAGTPAALRSAAGRLARWLEGDGARTALDDVAHTLTTRRSPSRERAAVVAADRPELLARLGELAAGAAPCDGVAAGRAVPDPGPGVVWVFSGHGGQWAGMCRRLLDREPEFTRVVDALEPLVARESGFSLRETLARPGVVTGFDRVQPVIFAIQLGLAALWRSHGVEPAAVIGHSVGEVAAAVAAGALGVRDGVQVVCRRSRLIARTAGRGLMASVALGRAEVERLLAEDDAHGVTVAVVASPDTTVVGGDSGRVRRLAARWGERGVGVRLVDVDVASHTAHMDPLLPGLADALAGLAPRAPETAFYSTVTDDPRRPGALDAAYWSANLRRVVRFSDAVRAAADDGHRLFVELGPHPLLLHSVRATLTAHGHTGTALVPSLLRDTDDVLAFHTHVAALHCAGHPLDWAERYGAGTLADVPPTTWERTRYAVDPSPLRRPAAALPAPHPLTGPRTTDPDGEGRHLWQTRITPTTLPWLGAHRVDDVTVVPGAALCEMAVAAATDLYATGPRRLRLTGIAFQRLLLPAADGTSVTATAETAGPGTARWRLLGTAPDGARAQHARARLHLAPADEDPPRGRDPRHLLAAFPHALDPADVYRQMREERGVHHGPPFRGLRALYGDGTRADRAGARLLARLHVPDDGRAGARTLHCHPVALDTCLQAVAAAVLRTGTVPAGGILPRGIAELRLHGPLPLTGHCLVTLRALEGARYTADFRLWDDDGAVAADATGVEFCHVPAENAGERFQRRLLGAEWEPAPRPAPAAAPGHWLLLTEPDRAGHTAALAAALERQGATTHVRTLGPDGTPGAPGAGPAGPAPRAVVYLPATAGRACPDRRARQQVARLLDTARALTRTTADGTTPPRLWTVTLAAQHVTAGDRPDLGAAGLRGLVRVLSYEHPELRPAVLDVEAHTPAAEVAAELLSCPDDQDEIAHRHGERYLARLRNAPLTERERRTATVDRARDRVGLHLARPGDLDSLEQVALDRRRPGPGEVEVRLAATSVNFINVLQAMGVYQGFRTGGEDPDVSAFDGAGVVTAVGEGVRTVREGDRVAAMFVEDAQSAVMSSHAHVRADCLLPVPPHTTTTQAAALPCAYLTAWYALRHLARLRAGETVLVHSASGGTGLAALNVARACGADVLATAGSEAKRTYLHGMGVPHVMDSRTLGFADEVRALTAGRGVDVVLNSLTGPAQSASLALLAHRGRFVELGKRDIHSNTRLGLLPFRRNLTFTGVDVLLMMQQDPDVLAEGYRELAGMLADGTLPPLPVTEHPLAGASAALHTMAAARHTGKLVLTWPARGTEDLPVRPGDVPVVRPDASYLITGGLGALGLLVARRLAERGAAAVVLASRGAPTEAVRETLDDLAATHGTRIDVVGGDLAEPGTADALVRAAGDTGHPLRGVVHAAAVVEDATVSALSPERLDRVWRPKVTGAWLLHHALGGRRLDWWVTFSSAASLLGNPGQGAYAAANAWLDEFTSWRRAQGLPATCVNWGPWAGTGHGAGMAERGYAVIDPAEGADALERLLAHDRARTAYTPLDLPRWLDSYPLTARTAFFAELHGDATGTAPSDGGGTLLADLRDTDDPRRREDLLRSHVMDHITAVLRLGTDRFDAHTSLVTLGLDSLMAIALRNRLQRALRLDIPTTVMWTHPTAAALTRHLLGRLYPDPAPGRVPAQAPSPDAR